MPEKQFLVSKVTRDHDVKGVEVDGQKMEFSKSGSSFFMTDAGKARELDATLGQKGTGDVVISEIPMANKEGIHNYTFSVKKPSEFEDDTESKYEWVEVKPGVQKMVKKEEKDASIRTA